MDTRMRLDSVLLARGLVASRSRARDLIKRGAVSVDGAIASKAGQWIGANAACAVEEAANRYVSRAALKLTAALSAFEFSVQGLVAIDVGASTGGFTEVLLEAGVVKVYAVDVGHDQLHGSLRTDPRVVCLEGFDARNLTSALVTESVGAIVSDVSFISQTLALSAAVALAAPGAWLVALIKPQFELTPGDIGKGGIVKRPELGARAVAKVHGWIASQTGWRVLGVVPSPIAGKGGNQEYLLGAIHDG